MRLNRAQLAPGHAVGGVGPAWAQPAPLVCWAARSSLSKSSKVALSTLAAAGSIDCHCDVSPSLWSCRDPESLLRHLADPHPLTALSPAPFRAAGWDVGSMAHT